MRCTSCCRRPAAVPATRPQGTKLRVLAQRYCLEKLKEHNSDRGSTPLLAAGLGLQLLWCGSAAAGLITSYGPPDPSRQLVLDRERVELLLASEFKQRIHELPNEQLVQMLDDLLSSQQTTAPELFADVVDRQHTQQVQQQQQQQAPSSPAQQIAGVLKRGLSQGLSGLWGFGPGRLNPSPSDTSSPAVSESTGSTTVVGSSTSADVATAPRSSSSSSRPTDTGGGLLAPWKAFTGGSSSSSSGDSSAGSSGSGSNSAAGRAGDQQQQQQAITLGAKQQQQQERQPGADGLLSTTANIDKLSSAAQSAAQSAASSSQGPAKAAMDAPTLPTSQQQQQQQQRISSPLTAKPESTKPRSASDLQEFKQQSSSSGSSDNGQGLPALQPPDQSSAAKDVEDALASDDVDSDLGESEDLTRGLLFGDLDDQSPADGSSSSLQEAAGGDAAAENAGSLLDRLRQLPSQLLGKLAVEKVGSDSTTAAAAVTGSSSSGAGGLLAPAQEWLESVGDSVKDLRDNATATAASAAADAVPILGLTAAAGGAVVLLGYVLQPLLNGQLASSKLSELLQQQQQASDDSSSSSKSSNNNSEESKQAATKQAEGQAAKAAAAAGDVASLDDSEVEREPKVAAAAATAAETNDTAAADSSSSSSSSSNKSRSRGSRKSRIYDNVELDTAEAATAAAIPWAASSSALYPGTPAAASGGDSEESYVLWQQQADMSRPTAAAAAGSSGGGGGGVLWQRGDDESSGITQNAPPSSAVASVVLPAAAAAAAAAADSGAILWLRTEDSAAVAADVPVSPVVASNGIAWDPLFEEDVSPPMTADPAAAAAATPAAEDVQYEGDYYNSQYQQQQEDLRPRRSWFSQLLSNAEDVAAADQQQQQQQQGWWQPLWQQQHQQQPWQQQQQLDPIQYDQQHHNHDHLQQQQQQNWQPRDLWPVIMATSTNIFTYSSLASADFGPEDNKLDLDLVLPENLTPDPWGTTPAGLAATLEDLAALGLLTPSAAAVLQHLDQTSVAGSGSSSNCSASPWDPTITRMDGNSYTDAKTPPEQLEGHVQDSNLNHNHYVVSDNATSRFKSVKEAKPAAAAALAATEDVAAALGVAAETEAERPRAHGGVPIIGVFQ